MLGCRRMGMQIHPGGADVQEAARDSARPQNPDFRAALAQLLDYGSDLWGVTVEGFDNAVVRRYLANTHCTNPAMKGATKLADAIHRAWPEIAADELDGLHARLSQVLAGGLFHFVVVAQRFTPSMENTVRYLNTRVGPGAFYLVELVRYEATTTSAFIGQVVAQPGTKIAAGTVTSISEEQFLASLSDESYRSALLRIFDTCKANGLQFKWQTKGASIRMPTPDRKDPLSIGWILPLGSTARGGARHLTLGVEPISLATTPSVTQAVTAYRVRLVKSTQSDHTTYSRINSPTLPCPCHGGAPSAQRAACFLLGVTERLPGGGKAPRGGASHERPGYQPPSQPR